jgi:heptosyltransferase-3
MRILFIKLRHIGDSLLLTPTIVATKKKLPNAEIWALVRESCDGILAGCPEIDRILTTANPDTTKRTKRGWLSDLRLAALLRRTKFDHVFELTDNDRARFLALAARTPNRCTNQHRTLRWFWRPFFHRICEQNRRREHQVVRDIVCPREALDLDMEPGPLRFAKSRMTPWKDCPDPLSPGYAVIHLHTRWRRKAWPLERWEELIGRLLETTPCIVLSCGPGSEEIEANRVLSSKFRGRVLSTNGKATWMELAWILNHAAFFVGVDTAAMHLASACACPSVVLFGPSPVHEYRPWKTKNWMIRPHDWLGEDAAKKIPPDKLMEEITVERVMAACKQAGATA